MKRSLPLFLTLLLFGCGSPADDHAHDGDHGHAHGEEDQNWSVTVWGDTYEIFAEVEPLVAGSSARSFTHVTRIEGFEAFREGTVSVILRGEAGETVFAQSTPARDGIFSIAVKPTAPGDYDLVYRVASGSTAEEIPAGRVRVGDHHGGGLLDKKASHGDVDFLKEQQWHTPFATAWAESAAIRQTVRGPARIRPRAGGEVILSAPQAGVVTGDVWPHPGSRYARGEAVFHLVPSVGSDRSLAELDAAVKELRAELEPAQIRMQRLEDLLALEATSQAEVESARAATAALQARLAAAEADLRTARSATSGERIPLIAPFAGSVSRVLVTRGEVVASGQALGRLIETDPLWIEVSLRPADLPAISGESFSLYLAGAGGAPGIEIPEDRVRYVSRSPEADPTSGMVFLLLEVTGPGAGLVPGTSVLAEVGLPGKRCGVVIPESAVVDDSGIPIVFTQESGESFARREVAVLAREGSRLLVSGLTPGMRLVTVGGAAIRRAGLASSGTGHGHAH